MSPHKRQSIATWTAIALTAIGGLLAGGSAYGRLHAKLAACEADISQLQSDSMISKTTLVRIETDVLWIRKTLEDYRKDKKQP